MPKCANKNLIDLLKQEKLEPKNTQVVFTVQHDIDSCAKINTKRYQEIKKGSLPVYRSTAVPEDLINICESIGCKNSGTLYIASDDEAVAGGEKTTYTHSAEAVFASLSDATNFLAGVAFYYAFVSKPGAYTVTTTISDVTDEAQKNADQYTTEIVANRVGYYPITIDLAKLPEKTIGEGWSASTNGVLISIGISTSNETEDSIQVGMSSIAFFDDIKDLEASDVVVLGCVSGISGDDTMDALEDTCGAAQLDQTSIAVEREITAASWSPNYYVLNPLMQKTEETESFRIKTVSKVVKEDDENSEYGSIHLSDYFVDECGFAYASVKNNCNITDSLISRVVGPNLMALDERQFQVINAKQNPDVKIIGSKLYFNKELIGQEIVIAYPQTIDVVEYVADAEGINSRRVKMYYENLNSDGVVTAFEYKNVLVTSFPRSLSNSDTEFTFNINVQPDRNGKYYHQKMYNKSGDLL